MADKMKLGPGRAEHGGRRQENDVALLGSLARHDDVDTSSSSSVSDTSLTSSLHALATNISHENSISVAEIYGAGSSPTSRHKRLQALELLEDAAASVMRT